MLRCDEDGYYFFVGRKAETVRHRGFTFATGQVEEVINGFEDVLESAVVGVPNESGEEDLKLLFVPKDSRVSPMSIRQRCEGAAGVDGSPLC